MGLGGEIAISNRPIGITPDQFEVSLVKMTEFVLKSIQDLRLVS